MGNLARGWAILSEQWHGHGNWAVWIAIFTAIWLPIGFAMAEKKKDKKTEGEDFRPLPRTPIPGSEKDYRREGTRLD